MDGLSGVYQLTSTRGSYAYLILDPVPILIDTGFPGRGKAMIQEMQAIGLSVTQIQHIVITHYDVDHIGNLAYLAEQSSAEVWWPQVDEPYILGTKPRPGIKRFIAQWVKTRLPDHYQSVSAGEHVGSLTAISSPGHTPGHLAYAGPGFIAVGDALMTKKGRLKPSPKILSWNVGESLQSARTLLERGQGLWILPAHGEPVHL